jgi:hypothetical protein
MKRTTDIEKIEKGGLFTWGEIEKIYKIGEYTIAEYRSWKRNGCQILTGEPGNEIQYHAWIGNKDTSCGYNSLESAIVGTIAYKFDGCNTRAGLYFCRMIGIGS